MFITRATGVMFAFFITWGIANLFSIEVRDMFLLVTFILTVDSLIVKYITRMYMKTLMNNLVEEEKDKKDV